MTMGEIKIVYFDQDGQDFYMYDSMEDYKADRGLQTYTSIIKVPDWDIEAAEYAHRNFIRAYCEPKGITPIRINPFLVDDSDEHG